MNKIKDILKIFMFANIGIAAWIFFQKMLLLWSVLIGTLAYESQNASAAHRFEIQVIAAVELTAAVLMLLSAIMILRGKLTYWRLSVTTATFFIFSYGLEILLAYREWGASSYFYEFLKGVAPWVVWFTLSLFLVKKIKDTPN
jgi:hypothetical protein